MGRIRTNRRAGGAVLVTGATGLLGSHLAERLAARGDRVRALVRPGEPDRVPRLDGRRDRPRRPDRARATARRPRTGVAQVYHCAAKVGDWGTWPEFQRGCMDATRTLAEAAGRSGVDRFLHISSTSAYGHPADRERPVDETEPLGQNVWFMDYYTRSKVDCERILWDLADAGKLPLTIIRPSWLFGERDRTTIPRFLREFGRRRVLIVGEGDNPLSAVYAGVVADAAILAANDPGSQGEAYNITNQGPITQREFLDLIADALAVPRVERHIPYRLAYAGGFLLEMQGRLLRQVPAAAGHPLRRLAPGPVSLLQHREGPHPPGLAAGPRLSREHRADDPVVPRSLRNPESGESSTVPAVQRSRSPLTVASGNVLLRRSPYGDFVGGCNPPASPGIGRLHPPSDDRPAFGPTVRTAHRCPRPDRGSAGRAGARSAWAGAAR